MKTLQFRLFLGALALVVLPVQAQDMPAKSDDTHAMHAKHDTSTTVIGVARAQGNFMTLLTAIDKAGLTETLMGEGPFTIFAPTDDAFGELPGGALDNLLKPENWDRLREVLAYHVIEGERFTASDLQSRAQVLNYELQTMGGLIAISSADSGIIIGGAAIAAADIEASNGIIHVMNKVVSGPSTENEVD